MTGSPVGASALRFVALFLMGACARPITTQFALRDRMFLFLVHFFIFLLCSCYCSWYYNSASCILVIDGGGTGSGVGD